MQECTLVLDKRVAQVAGLVVNHLSRPIREVLRHLVFKVRWLTLLLLYLTMIIELREPSNCLILFRL